LIGPETDLALNRLALHHADAERLTRDVHPKSVSNYAKAVVFALGIV